MAEMHKYIARLTAGEILAGDDAAHMFQIIMKGGASPAQIAAALIAMKQRGETVDEIVGAVQAMQIAAKKFDIDDALRAEIVDCCGTGGDGKGSLNISTAVAFVLAGGGVKVAKHGNKAVSSSSGSADVLRELGVQIDASEERMKQALDEVGICFLMAPNYHPAMRHVAPVRQELKTRTIFNLLGPLANPARPKRQLIGVYSEDWVEPMAEVAGRLGAEHVWVVHGKDGMDELSIGDETIVAEWKDGAVERFAVKPEDIGIECADDDALAGGDARHNASALNAVLGGEEGAYRDAVVLNAAAGFVVAGKVESLSAGAALAKQSIDDGAAKQALKDLVAVTNLDHVG